MGSSDIDFNLSSLHMECVFVIERVGGGREIERTAVDLTVNQKRHRGCFCARAFVFVCHRERERERERESTVGWIRHFRNVSVQKVVIAPDISTSVYLYKHYINVYKQCHIVCYIYGQVSVPSGAIWQYRSWSALVHLMAFLHKGHYVDQFYSDLICEVLCSRYHKFTANTQATIQYNEFENLTSKMFAISPRGRIIIYFKGLLMHYWCVDKCC